VLISLVQPLEHWLGDVEPHFISPSLSGAI